MPQTKLFGKTHVRSSKFMQTKKRCKGGARTKPNECQQKHVHFVDWEIPEFLITAVGHARRTQCSSPMHILFDFASSFRSFARLTCIVRLSRSHRAHLMHGRYDAWYFSVLRPNENKSVEKRTSAYFA